MGVLVGHLLGLVSDMSTFAFGKIANFVLELLCLVQSRPSTMKTSKSMLKLSKLAQFHPFQSAGASIQLNGPFYPRFLFTLDQHRPFSPPHDDCTEPSSVIWSVW